MKAGYQMRLLQYFTAVKEPVKYGLVTGFAGMSAAAAIQLVSELSVGHSPLSGIAGLMMALVLATVSGATAALLISRLSNRNAADLCMAQALAKGDYSSSVLTNVQQPTALGLALEKIAGRDLARETEKAVALKDASLRQDQLADALDAIPHEIAVYNKDGILVNANRSFVTNCQESGAVVALGMTRNEVITSLAKAFGSNLPINERQTWINLQESIRADSQASNAPVRYKAGNDRFVEILIVKSSDGNTTELVRDVTLLVELEDRVQRAEREAAAAESIKQVTISRLSHTIRTPMTGVLAATELLSGSELDERQRERLDIIRRSASTLLGVVQDMFDMAAFKEQTQVSVLNPEPKQKSALVLATDPEAMANSIENLKKQDFVVGIAESMDLLTETLKVLAGQDRTPDLVLVPDQTALNTLRSRLGGVTNQSDIHIETVQNQNETIDNATNSKQSDNGVDLIVAESDEVNRIAYANALSASNLSYRIASTAEEAIDLSVRLRARLFLIDMTLPDMDGLKAAAAIRKAYGSKPGLGLLIAMTSHFVTGDKGKCMAAGMDDYLLKPTIGSDLVLMADRILQTTDLKKAG